MKITVTILRRIYLLIIFILNAYVLMAQPTFELSQNIYRVPYENNEIITVKQDPFTHDPPGRYDLRANGTDDCSSHRIAAAAAGTVRFVVQNNDTSCSSCGAQNNYVWIEHANGEWSKYTHFKKNSVLVVKDQVVCAGTLLGYECWVGATSPAQNRHLHFELRRPNDPLNPVINPAGGFMDAADGLHLIPVFNSFSKHYLEQNDVVIASSSNSCTSTNLALGAFAMANNQIKIYMASGTIDTNSNSIVFFNGSNGLFHAGSSVTLSPGFSAATGSYFNARIGSCAPATVTGCN